MAKTWDEVRDEVRDSTYEHPDDADFAIVSRDDGLTDAEGVVADHLVAAYNAYAGELPVQHPSEVQDFANAIHICQQLLVMRIARRHYPKGWPDKGSGIRVEDLTEDDGS